MYKANKRHLQPHLLSTLNDLPEKQRKRLEASWAGTFYREAFCRIPEDIFKVLYADCPSRPNIPVNVLMGAELLKAHFGWTDEELYDHFQFDLQVRYALGYDRLDEGEFELRSLYNFRQRLAKYYLETDKNLLTQAFEQMSDGQALDYQVKLKVQRMDSTQMMSNIVDASRMQLLVEAIHRLARILSETDLERLSELLAPYLKQDAQHYVYRVKGKEAQAEHLQQIGQTMYALIQALGSAYEQEPVYQMFRRIFADNYRIEAQIVAARANSDISSGCLQSVDDQEATYRKKGANSYKGYVANISESCAPENPFQLITQVQVAPNNQEDADLLADSLPELKKRTGVESLYTDGAFGSPRVDEVSQQEQVEIVNTGIRGNTPDPNKFNLADFEIVQAEDGKPSQITCPHQQSVAVLPGRTTGFLASFDPQICQDCPHYNQQCRVKAGKKDPHPKLSFTQQEVNWARRRKRYQQFKQEKGNPRAAAEATVRSVKHPFPAGKLSVIGKFRVTYMVVASAAMVNVKRIHRYLTSQRRTDSPQKPPKQAENSTEPSAASTFFAALEAILRPQAARFRHLQLVSTCFSF